MPSVVEKALAFQRQSTKMGKRLRSVLLVLDDCTYDPRIFRSTAMRDLAMNGRHQSISLWTSCQYLVDLPPAIRGQIDYVFAFHEPVLDNTIARSDPSECLFWFCARVDLPKFTMCKSVFWKLKHEEKPQVKLVLE